MKYECNVLKKLQSLTDNLILQLYNHLQPQAQPKVGVPRSAAPPPPPPPPSPPPLS